MPSASEADVLDLVPGASMIHLVHVAEAAGGTVLEVPAPVPPAERIVIVDEYAITPDPDALAAVGGPSTGGEGRGSRIEISRKGVVPVPDRGSDSPGGQRRGRGTRSAILTTGFSVLASRQQLAASPAS